MKEKIYVKTDDEIKLYECTYNEEIIKTCKNRLERTIKKGPKHTIRISKSKSQNLNAHDIISISPKANHREGLLEFSEYKTEIIKEYDPNFWAYCVEYYNYLKPELYIICEKLLNENYIFSKIELSNIFKQIYEYEPKDENERNILIDLLRAFSFNKIDILKRKDYYSYIGDNTLFNKLINKTHDNDTTTYYDLFVPYNYPKDVYEYSNYDNISCHDAREKVYTMLAEERFLTKK